MLKWLSRLLLVGLGLIGLALVVAGTWFLTDITVLPRMVHDFGWVEGPAPTATLPVVRYTASPTALATFGVATFTPPNATPTFSPPPVPSLALSPTASQTVTPAPGATDAALVCANTYPTQLRKGMRVYASLYPNLPNRIREQATTRAKILGMIYPGEEADVLDGPVCAEGWIWWKIKKDNGLTGWTAEGDGKDYWILPKK